MKMKHLAYASVCIVMLMLTGCSDTEMSAAVRGPETIDGSVYIDEDAIALAGSIPNESMTEQEIARAAELRVLATAAFDQVNNQRVAAGLTALVWSDGLEQCAQVRATECNELFSHTRPNQSDWWTVNSEIMWGENLAKGYKTADSVVTAWMNSPTHAANILYGDFNTIGIAIYEIDGKIYWAQEFGF